MESKDRAFALLSVLYPFVDTQNNKFHIDHVFPKSRFFVAATTPGRRV